MEGRRRNRRRERRARYPSCGSTLDSVECTSTPSSTAKDNPRHSPAGPCADGVGVELWHRTSTPFSMAEYVARRRRYVEPTIPAFARGTAPRCGSSEPRAHRWLQMSASMEPRRANVNRGEVEARRSRGSAWRENAANTSPDRTSPLPRTGLRNTPPQSAEWNRWRTNLSLAGRQAGRPNNYPQSRKKKRGGPKQTDNRSGEPASNHATQWGP